jgi:hypothetical protein
LAVGSRTAYSVTIGDLTGNIAVNSPLAGEIGVFGGQSEADADDEDEDEDEDDSVFDFSPEPESFDASAGCAPLFFLP